jgi:hypothetical protein
MPVPRLRVAARFAPRNVRESLYGQTVFAQHLFPPFAAVPTFPRSVNPTRVSAVRRVMRRHGRSESKYGKYNNDNTFQHQNPFSIQPETGDQQTSCALADNQQGNKPFCAHDQNPNRFPNVER